MEPFLNQDQILNQVFDNENKLLRVDVKPGDSTHDNFPTAAYKNGKEFGAILVENGYRVSTVLVDCA